MGEAGAQQPAEVSEWVATAHGTAAGGEEEGVLREEVLRLFLRMAIHITIHMYSTYLLNI